MSVHDSTKEGKSVDEPIHASMGSIALRCGMNSWSLATDKYQDKKAVRESPDFFFFLNARGQGEAG